jgi:hypothetical protein
LRTLPALGSRSGSAQPYGFDFLIRLDSFAVRNLAGSTLLNRWFLSQLYRWFPLQVLTIVRPETLVRWHRAGFRCYWRWKSRPLGGRPQIDSTTFVNAPASL